jgi:hypothetical protein
MQELIHNLLGKKKSWYDRINQNKDFK